MQGDTEEWLGRCTSALEHQGFRNIEIVCQLGQAHASYKKLTVWGWIDITLVPRDSGQTEMRLVVTANVDNLYALFRSPTRKILQAFKAGLLEYPGAAEPTLS